MDFAPRLICYLRSRYNWKHQALCTSFGRECYIEEGMANDRFSVVDYVVFSIMLLISALIGMWYGCRPGAKQKTTAEYLLGGREMKAWPVALSVLVSFLSALYLLGLQGEIYTNGTQFYVLIFGYVLICTTTSTVFIPMFRRIKLTSVFEYFGRRYSSGMRMLGCISFIVAATMYLFVELFAPSLALEVVAGIPLTVSILATGAVCTFYTSLGGLKAVIWTDVFQSVVMLAGLVIVAVTGSIEVGGLQKVWEINKDHGRINFFNFDPDPRIRNTFWSIVIGGYLSLLPVLGCTQLYVQRYLAVKTLKDARRVMWLNIPGLFLVITICTLDGMVIFATYAGCDLKEQGKITSGDQVLPYFVINKLGHVKGLPGMFTACLYGAALSTVSSTLNAMSLVTLEDIIKKKITLSEAQATKIRKALAVVFGVIVMAGAVAVKYTHLMVLQLSYSIHGICGGALLAALVLGMFVPRINSKGAFTGVFAGYFFSTWVFIGSMFYPPDQNPGVRSVKECPFYQCALREANNSFSNGTICNNPAEILGKYKDGLIPNPNKPYTSTPIADLYGLSYLWLSGLSFGAAVVVAVIASFVFETKEDRQREVDPKLLFPLKAWLRGFLPGHKFTWEEETDVSNEYENEMKEDQEKDSEDRMKAETACEAWTYQDTKF